MESQNKTIKKGVHFYCSKFDFRVYSTILNMLEFKNLVLPSMVSVKEKKILFNVRQM